LATFRNIRMPTATVDPPLGGTTLWRFLSHLAINQMPLADTDNLRSLLRLYIFPDSRDRGAVYANRKRVDGIQRVAAEPASRIVTGRVMRGRDVRLEVAGDHFASQGDLYLFGTVLDHFLGGYASLNSYTRLALRDVTEGHGYQWPARVGDRQLL
jgi:type VI secretion system protein ImpG